jgi:hypothetical protein
MSFVVCLAELCGGLLCVNALTLLHVHSEFKKVRIILFSKELGVLTVSKKELGFGCRNAN